LPEVIPCRISTTPMVRKERITAPVIEQWRRKDMIMMAPVTERRRELLQSPARYID